jgi:hypothetical protein
MLERIQGKMNPHTLWECESTQPLCKAVWRFLRKLKTGLLVDPLTPFLGIYFKEY